MVSVFALVYDFDEGVVLSIALNGCRGNLILNLQRGRVLFGLRCGLMLVGPGDCPLSCPAWFREHVRLNLPLLVVFALTILGVDSCWQLFVEVCDAAGGEGVRILDSDMDEVLSHIYWHQGITVKNLALAGGFSSWFRIARGGIASVP